MLKTRKYYRQKATELEIFRRGLSGWDDNSVIGVGKKCSLAELEKWLKEKISKSGLQIVDQKNSKMVCIVYAEYPDSEGYDVFGCSCFIGKLPKTPKISYCGLCGDVNSFYITDTNSVKVFVR